MKRKLWKQKGRKVTGKDGKWRKRNIMKNWKTKEEKEKRNIGKEKRKRKREKQEGKIENERR